MLNDILYLFICFVCLLVNIGNVKGTFCLFVYLPVFKIFLFNSLKLKKKRNKWPGDFNSSMQLNIYCF